LGNDVEEQLYNLKRDRNEQTNLAAVQKEKLLELKALLEQEMSK